MTKQLVRYVKNNQNLETQNIKRFGRKYIVLKPTYKLDYFSSRNKLKNERYGIPIIF